MFGVALYIILKGDNRLLVIIYALFFLLGMDLKFVDMLKQNLLILILIQEIKKESRRR